MSARAESGDQVSACRQESDALDAVTAHAITPP